MMMPTSPTVEAELSPASELLTVRQVAERLKCAPSTVYQLVDTGKLRSFRIGRRGGAIRVSEEQLQQYLEDCRSLPTNPTRAPPRPKLLHIKM